MKVIAWLSVAFVSAVGAWTRRWDHSKKFDAAGLQELQCDGQLQPAACCICNTVLYEIQSHLDNTKNDYEMDVVFRLSEEKKTIMYSRSEARILEVLDHVCDPIPLRFASTKKKGLLMDACHAFVGEFEDEITRLFFNDFTPVTDRMCIDTLKVCKEEPKPTDSPTNEHADL